MMVALKMLTASLLVYMTAGVVRVHGLEEPAPEVFLQPRNFNPHPYELGYDPSYDRSDRQVSRLRDYANQIDVFTGHNRGPVLFPPNHPAGDNRITDDPYVVAKLKDAHPYAGVAAKKKKFGLGLGRFADEPEQHSPQVYKALAAHGAKVLQVPRAKDLKNVPNLDIDYDYNDETKKNYAFSYKVVDHLTGDVSSHSQSQDAHATNGEYRVKLPDGRIQIVSYTADKNGYKADVKYSGSKHTDTLHQSHQPQQHQHRFATPPTHQHLSQDPAHIPLYADSLLHVGQHHQHHYNDITVKSHAHDFINQHLITDDGDDGGEQVGAAERTAYYDDAITGNPNVVLILRNKYEARTPGKVQLLPNIHEQKVHEHGKFIAATLAPYIVSNGQRRNVQTLSTLAPDLDKFNPVYIDAPKYKLPTTIHQ